VLGRARGGGYAGIKIHSAFAKHFSVFAERVSVFAENVSVYAENVSVYGNNIKAKTKPLELYELAGTKKLSAASPISCQSCMEGKDE
jgi:hypothetical protein